MTTIPNKKRRRDSNNVDDRSRSGSTVRLLESVRTPFLSSATPTAFSPSGYVVIHCVDCTGQGRFHQHHEQVSYFLDVPHLPVHSNRKTCLHGQQRLMDLENYFDDHAELSFAVCKTYSCTAYHEKIKEQFERLPMPNMNDEIAMLAKPYFYILRKDAGPAEPSAERLMILEGLTDSLHMLLKSSIEDAQRHGEDKQVLPRSWQVPNNLVYPYMQLYRERGLLLERAVIYLETTEQLHLHNLSRYLENRLGEDYADAETLFSSGMVSRSHWAKLFRPGELLVSNKTNQPMAYMSTSCPFGDHNVLHLECWFWEFDGKFFQENVVLPVEWPSENETIAITDLHTYPLQYAHAGLEDELRNRGKVFWACRSRRFVNYDAPLQGMEVQITNLRYMVDTTTYKLMHGNENEEPAADRVDLEEEIMRADSVPAEPFVLLLPATIRGYGFHNKKWNRLLVKHIRDIEWNKAAFNHRLVLREEKKELIRALVSVHMGQKDTVKTDFMDGKGEGLIILLHGGPGTGKTLTAESVAEYAELPLYRVTCGDIGTDAESVEKYLDSVLFIGSTWGCVVLLDEADVFLEERTKQDMQRNALVSVFLRVLEYYDGILILTTNRIGTFDEAFKSRVQLALHYPPLNEKGREEIWHNFMRSLKKAEENVDFEGIEEKLHVLAKHTLNGRQIRNTISTARQLARYKKDQLRFVHINQALQVVDEFEKYVSDVHGHSDEEYARELGNR